MSAVQTTATPKQRSYLAELRRAYAPGASNAATISLSILEASAEIKRHLDHAARWPWRPLTKQSIIAERAYQLALSNGRQFGPDKFDALESILASELQSWRPLTFRTNDHAILDRAAATAKARQVMSMVAGEVNRQLAEQPREQHEQHEQPREQHEQPREQHEQPREQHEQHEQPRDELSRAIEEAFEQPRDEQPRNSVPVVIEARMLYERINRLRAFARSRDGLDSLDSMRVQLDAKRALDAGCAADGIVSSIIAHWSDETIRQAGERRFNYAAFGERADRTHAVWPYVERLIRANVPVYLHGPAGTGKSSAARQAAANLGLDYHELNLAGAMASAIRGRDTLQGFAETPFIHAYRDGGVLVLEEIDAAHPNVLTAINNAVANGHWANEAMDCIIERHQDFRIVATGNTLGTGATKDFTGRMRLDGATLDRFRVGRVRVDLDEQLERELLGI